MSDDKEKEDSNEKEGEENQETKTKVALEETLLQNLENQDDKTRVDFSSQGLTIVPSSLLSRTNITVLNLSSNNIRSLPSDIGKLVNMCKLDVSRNGLACANANDFSGLPASMEALVRLTDVNLSECNLMCIPPALWKIPSIERLDISRNKVKVIPMEIMNLINLRYLNATQTGITTLPEEIVCCDQLESLLIVGNPIQTLPDTMREMIYLRNLAINLRIFALRVDDETNMMLKKQQVTSEHIPAVVYDIPRLKALDMEKCKMNSLPNSITRSLEELNVNANYFPMFPQVITTLSRLHTLEIADNNFSTLPDSILQLKHLKVLIAHHNSFDKFGQIRLLKTLEKLDLGHNKIKEIPSAIGAFSNLKKLLLNNNKIEEIPDAIGDLNTLETLDLTGNLIKFIPKKLEMMTGMTTAHDFRGLFKHGLWLHKNPIENPPPKVWMTWDPKKIWHYMKQLEIQTISNLQTCKMILVGDCQTGKSTFARTISSGYSRCSKPEQYTIGYKVQKWTTRNKCKVVILDTGGHDIVKPMIPKLLDSRALCCIIFDVNAYVNMGFQCISYWLDLIRTYEPEAKIKLIGTKMDILKASQNDDDKSQESKNDCEGEYEDQAETEADPVQDLLASLNSDLLRYRHRWETQNSENKPTILESISLVACDASLQGIEEFHTEMEWNIMDKSMLPHLQRYIPENWIPFQAAIKKIPGVYVDWETLEMLGEEKNMRGSQLEDCVQHMASTGKVIWLQKHPRLRKIIFHRLNILQSAMEKLLRVDMDEFLDYDENKLFKCCGKMSAQEFQEVKQACLTYGEFSWPLLRTLLFGHKITRQTLSEVFDCMEFFGIAAHTPSPTVPIRDMYKTPVLIIYYYLRDTAENDLILMSDDIRGLSHKRKIVFRFPDVPPVSLFNDLRSVMHTIVDYRIDSVTSVYAVKGDVHLLAKETDSDTLDYTIEVTLISQSGMQAQEMAEWLTTFFTQEKTAAPELTYEVEDINLNV